MSQASFYVTCHNRKKPKQFFFLGYFRHRVLRQLEVININLAKRPIVFTILFFLSGGDTTPNIFKMNLDCNVVLTLSQITR